MPPFTIRLCLRRRENGASNPPACAEGRQVYGKRAHIHKWTYENLYVEALDKTFEAAHQTCLQRRALRRQVVRTKMCPQPVHLIVIRTKPKKSRPYRYFLVFTTDLTLSVETIVHYYHLRWKIETGFRDSKESFGFDHYQVRSETAIQRSVVLSFLSASLTQLLALPKFQQAHPDLPVRVRTQTGALPKLKVALKEMSV